VRGQFGDCDLDLPRIGGSFSLVRGWVTSCGGLSRCSDRLIPPNVSSGTGSTMPLLPVGPPSVITPLDPAVTGAAAERPRPVAFLASDYWSGTYLHAPDQGAQELLERAPGYVNSPADGGSYPIVTHGNWQISCLSLVQNFAGEGFLAVSPQGVRYRFDWMASRLQTGVKLSGASIGRQDMFLMATRVSDKLGNWVHYTYEPSNPLLLSRIDS